MQSDIVNIGLGFLEGFALIISPCIYPILPIILSGSLTGSKKRPIGIVIGFVITFSLFTFFSRQLVQYFNIDLTLVRHISDIILFLLGVVMISNYLTEKVSTFTQALSNTGSTLDFANNTQGGLWSGILFGAIIALIWTPCAGPILAAVIVQTATQQSNVISFLTLITFSLGAAIPMLIIAFFGRSVMNKFGFFKTHGRLLRKILGIIIIASVFYMVFLETGFAKNHVTQQSTSAITTQDNQSTLKLEDGLANPYPAPAIGGIETWINSNPIALNNLKGKVVLIDFWTYSCINCIRTLPYLKEWYNKYHDRGLVIIGVHTPEFEFEKNSQNVRNAVIKEGIHYPVALDNHFTTWQNFNNQYWPAHYLIDKNGMVVYTHFGEGDYTITENNIRYLLGLKTAETASPKAQEDFSGEETPETYLGYDRENSFSSIETLKKNEPSDYTFPALLPKDNWALNGNWTITAEKIIANKSNASLKMHFYAKKVFLVMGTTQNQPVSVHVLLDGKDIGSNGGKDVINTVLTVKQHRLYEIVALSNAGSHTLQLTSAEPDLELYAFTFGA